MEVTARTELLHALLVRFIQEEIALFDRAVDLETQAQTGVFHQLRVDVMDQSLQRDRRTQNKVGDRDSVGEFEGEQALSPPAWCCLVLTGAYPPFSFENLCGKS